MAGYFLLAVIAIINYTLYKQDLVNSGLATCYFMFYFTLIGEAVGILVSIILACSVKSEHYSERCIQIGILCLVSILTVPYLWHLTYYFIGYKDPVYVTLSLIIVLGWTQYLSNVMKESGKKYEGTK